MSYTLRPISDHTWLRPSDARVPSRFDSPWTSTLQLLSDEIDRLDGRNVVLEIDVPERGFRKNGELRSGARADSPAVVVAFDGKHGPMQYRCDRFVEPSWRRGVDWQQNVRAIALTLESLRAVDRYGATDTGQQYAGFKALGSGTAMPSSPMTQVDAAQVLAAYSGKKIDALSPEHVLRSAHRKARTTIHPDRLEGDRTAWDRVEQAAKVLGVLS